MNPPADRCILCQTPISPKTAAGSRGQYCCAGCEKVYEVLSHLDEGAKAAYVVTARKLGIIPAQDNSTPRQYNGESTDQSVGNTNERTDSLRTERLQVDGLVCPSCSWVSNEILNACRGVRQASVNYFTGTAQITYDMTETGVEDLDRTLRPLGYGLTVLSDKDQTAVSRRATYQFVITAILTMNVMSLSVLRYFHALGYLESVPSFLGWIEGALVVPILYIGWLPTARRAGAALRHGKMTMDLLIALGVFAAALLSAVSLFLGLNDMYFDTCAGLVTISLLSRMIEARLRDNAFVELTRLMKMPVIRVRQRTPDDDEVYTDTADIRPGDCVRFLQGEMVSLDGEVVGARAVVTEAQLTGEPSPLSKSTGDLVTAGSTVLEGILDLRVMRRFDDTLLGKIAKSIGEVLSTRETGLRQADRIAAIFTPAVLAVSGGAWAARAALFGMNFALSPEGWFPSVAVLAVACPCAFSLAGISAVTAAVGALLHKGFLVNEIGALDALEKIDHAVFDKTGTLTQGVMTVEKLIFNTDADNDLLLAVMRAESGARHPTAEAIRGYLHAQGIEAIQNAEIPAKDLPGRGRFATVGDKILCVGNASLFDNPFVPDGISPNHTAVWFGWNNKAAGCFLLTDEIKKSAVSVIADLKSLNISTELLSGDRTEVAIYVAGQLGINSARGGAAIADKIAAVDARRAAGKHVVYIGDGTNDAEAMSRAHVSIAPAKSTDEALGAAGLIAIKGDIAHLAEVFAIGRKLARVSRQNYTWAFAFNTLFIPVAAFGKLVPLAAMLLMLLSSAAVLVNSARLKGE